MQTYLKRIIGGILAIITSFSLFGCSSNQIDEGKMATDMEEILTQLFMSVQCGDKNTFRNFLVKSSRLDNFIWADSEKAIADIILRKAADKKGWNKMSDTELILLEDITDEIFQKQLIQIDKLKVLRDIKDSLK